MKGAISNVEDCKTKGTTSETNGYCDSIFGIHQKRHQKQGLLRPERKPAE